MEGEEKVGGGEFQASYNETLPQLKKKKSKQRQQDKK